MAIRPDPLHIEIQYMLLDKPQLKIGFADYFDPVPEFFTDWLSDSFVVVRDDYQPDYIIFCDEMFGISNKRFDNQENRPIKIFYTGENRRFWNYTCDYAITFDHYQTNRHYRLPLYVIDNWVHVNKMGLPSIIHGSMYKHTVADKKGFCSFVVANGWCAERNNIFHLLSLYKKVDSGGPLFNNIGYILPRDGVNAQKTKFDFLKDRKFNICYENSSYPGYATEKLFHALYLNTVPIYWGSPTIGEDFNMEGVVNRHYFSSDKEMIQWIIHLDQNDDLYNQYLEASHEMIINKYSQVLSRANFNRWFRENVYNGDKMN